MWVPARKHSSSSRGLCFCCLAVMLRIIQELANRANIPHASHHSELLCKVDSDSESPMLPPLLGCTPALPLGFRQRASGTPHWGSHVPPHLLLLLLLLLLQGRVPQGIAARC